MQNRNFHRVQEDLNNHFLLLFQKKTTGLPPWEFAVKAVELQEYEPSFINNEYLQMLYFAVNDLLSAVGQFWESVIEHNKEAGTVTKTESYRYFGKRHKTSGELIYSDNHVFIPTGIRGPVPITGIVSDFTVGSDGQVSSVTYAPDEVGYEIPKLWQYGQPTGLLEQMNVQLYMHRFTHDFIGFKNKQHITPKTFEEFITYIAPANQFPKDTPIALHDLNSPELAIYCNIAQRHHVIPHFDTGKALEKFLSDHNGRNERNFRRNLKEYTNLLKDKENIGRLEKVRPFFTDHPEALKEIDNIVDVLKSKKDGKILKT